jgi:hypothetical protein
MFASLMENELNRNYRSWLTKKLQSSANLGQDKTKDTYDSYMGFIEK